jgi:hypothetical protein
MQSARKEFVGFNPAVAYAAEHPLWHYYRTSIANHRHKTVGWQRTEGPERPICRLARKHHNIQRPGDHLLGGRRGVTAQAGEGGCEIVGCGMVT